jgi:hypothetical protein
VALDGIAVLVDDELGEVPLDGVEQGAALLLLQVLEEGMSSLSVDINLLEQIELHFSVASEALNLLAITRLLVSELIARKRENAETLTVGREKRE